MTGVRPLAGSFILALLTAGTMVPAAGPAVAAAAAAAPLRERAGDPYVAAARAANVPLDLLVAIAGTESGYHPWALNIDGQQIYCRSEAEARQKLATTDQVDIGLMQINWPFWGPRLGLTKTEILEPRLNLLYGARILKQSLARGGSLWRRISNYHAGSSRERKRYNQQVYATYQQYLRGDLR